MLGHHLEILFNETLLIKKVFGETDSSVLLKKDNKYFKVKLNIEIYSSFVSIFINPVY